MLESISKLGTQLSKKEQSQITGGSWPQTEKACIRCGGGWFAPFCLLPVYSPCAS
jgi:hypothetical protein